jgi:hypothetical protein
VIDPDLDQFVTGETGVDLLDDRFGEAVLADRDHGMQGMGAGAQARRSSELRLSMQGTFFEASILAGFQRMNRSRSSNAWLREHVNDTYVQRAQG